MQWSYGASTPTPRIFGVGVCAGHLVVHDPLTGTSYHRDQLVTLGRTRLRAHEVATHRVADPEALGGPQALGVRWSSVAVQVPSPTGEPADSAHRRAARALACAGLLTVDIHEVDPLPISDLTDIAGHLTDDGCTVSLTTEHRQLERHAEELADCVDALRVSVDSAVTDTGQLDRAELDRCFGSLAASARAVTDAGLPIQLYTSRIPPLPGNDATQRLIDLAAVTGIQGVTFARPSRGKDPLPPANWGTDAPSSGTLRPLDIPLETVHLAESDVASGL